MDTLLILGLIPVVLVAALAFIFVWNKPIILIYTQIFYVCTMRFIYSELPIPSSIRYLTDIITVILFVQTFVHIRRKISQLNMRLPILFCSLFVLFTVISFVLSGQSIVTYAWGVRILFRFFVFFFACAVFLHKEDIMKIINMLLWLLPMNVLASSFQYFVQGYTYDYNGGLFGMEVGCNAEMNMYLVQLLIFSFAMYLQNRFTTKKLILILAMCLYIAALTELKVLFFEIPLIFICLALLFKPSKKMIGIAVAGSGALYVGIMLFLVLYPDWADFFSLDMLKYYTVDSAYAGGETLNRLSANQYVFSNLLDGIQQKLFGVGLGNADISSFFTTDYYEKYEHLKYTYFGHAHCLFETGLLGLITYLGVFIGSGIHSFIMMRKKQIDIAIAAVGCVTGFLAIFYGLYNQALRTEISYVYFFWLAAPFVLYKERNIVNETEQNAIQNL